MSKPKKRKRRHNKEVRSEPRLSGLRTLHFHACHLAELGELTEASRLLESVLQSANDPSLQALILNDLAVVAALSGDLVKARQGFQTALARKPDCPSALVNAALLAADDVSASPLLNAGAAGLPIVPPNVETRAVKIAILSFLFNWPSTGGGNVHTAELALFLGRAGYEVRHFYVRYAPWAIGNVTGTPFPGEPLEFTQAEWNLSQIQERIRLAVDNFKPDHVIITDSWNIKPALAEAVAGYPYIMRFQAMECLCPLNNVRLLPSVEGQAKQCGRHQLATPEECGRCLRENGQWSGSLHQAERALSEVETPGYYQRLRNSLANAEAVLVVNPLTEALVSPYCRSVRVVTAGMDPARFPLREDTDPVTPGKVQTIFFAGLVEEWMKGFPILHKACSLLWRKRQDFRLVATGDPPGQVDEFTSFVGWQSQADLPRHLHESDMLAMPTIAQEALGRTAVEAMAAGRPVIASRLGGLPSTVMDGATGLLCEPGNLEDLANKIEMLLDDPVMRHRMGKAGRRRFEEHYSWDVIIERHYKPLLGPPRGPGPSVNGFVPIIPDRVDKERLSQEICQFFGLERAETDRRLDIYRRIHEAKEYARTLGEFKTLCFEEAFILFVLLGIVKPPCIAVVGVGDGKATRRILDMVTTLGLDSQIVCFDPVSMIQHFAPEEATVIASDISGRFAKEVLEPYQPGIVFLDIHTHALLHEAISQTMLHPGAWTLALHDCGKGLCNSHMSLGKDDLRVTSATGVWERHVLAGLFEVSDPKGNGLDEAQTASHRLHIFDTPHGLGVILPKKLANAKQP
jgi:glycosyltransferase involved in cell wall biosynthesis